MLPSLRKLFRTLRLFSLIALVGVVLVSCGPTGQQTSAPTSPYDRAKDAFKNSQLEKALGLTDKLATATPPGDFTERARVLRAVIYAGELKCKVEMASAYDVGINKVKNPQFKAEYRRLHNDNLQGAAQAALNLAETSHQIIPDGVIAKELTLEAAYPTAEGPGDIQGLMRVKDGGWLEPDQQDVAATDSMRKGIDDALAEVVSGDHTKARNALAGGSVKLDGAAFAIFLSDQLADGAEVFDRKHARDSMKMKALCDEGQEALKAAQALLKAAPDKDKDKQIKKLQDKYKSILKNG